GVWVDIDRRYLNTHGGSCYSCYATINIEPGYQRLTGGKALDFVRFRHTDSDFVRVARQQLFVQAMKEQFRSAFSPLKIPKLVGAVADNVEVGAGGGQHPSLSTVLSYARFIYELPPGHFFQARINGITGQYELSAPASDIQSAVHDFLTPDVKAVRDANTVALGGKVKASVPKPGQTTVVVLNGNGVPGSAAEAKSLLAQRGYRMRDVPQGRLANAPHNDFGYFHSKVYYDPRSRQARAAAGSLADQFAPAEPVPITPAIRRLENGAMLVVVVGKTFHNSLTPVEAKPVITHQPPHVVSNREATLGYLRDAQRKVPFELEVPNVIDSSSIPDPEMPIRVYTIQGNHKAVRLVFRTGGNAYWGVEETDWQD